jgi:hypothetical protein
MFMHVVAMEHVLQIIHAHVLGILRNHVNVQFALEETLQIHLYVMAMANVYHQITVIVTAIIWDLIVPFQFVLIYQQMIIVYVQRMVHASLQTIAHVIQDLLDMIVVFQCAIILTQLAL